LKGYVEFFFTLPKDDVPIGTQSDLLPKDSQEILLTLEKFRIQNSNQGLKTDAEEIQLETEILQLLRKPVTILVLDDEAVYRNALLSLISKSENLKKLISIHAVQHSSDAIDFAQGMNPILAILDIDLGPGSISGLETAMELRKVGYLNRICIHSNRFFADDFKKAMEVGANSVLPKPMTRAHFLKAILEALS
jgi:CheY-like chemotaxis protein